MSGKTSYERRHTSESFIFIFSFFSLQFDFMCFLCGMEECVCFFRVAISYCVAVRGTFVPTLASRRFRIHRDAKPMRTGEQIIYGDGDGDAFGLVSRHRVLIPRNRLRPSNQMAKKCGPVCLMHAYD